MRLPYHCVDEVNKDCTTATATATATNKAMAILDVVTGMTAAPRSDFSKSIPIMTLKDGAVVRTWKNLVGYDHVFLSDSKGNIIYGGFVGWIHCKDLQNAIAQMRRELTQN